MQSTSDTSKTLIKADQPLREQKSASAMSTPWSVVVDSAERTSFEVM